MNSHKRARSKGSFSILSIDKLRSFSRADSRQARAFDDAEESIISSPERTNTPTNSPSCPVSKLTIDLSSHKSKSTLSTSLSNQNPINNTNENQFSSRTHGIRSLSWLPFSRSVAKDSRNKSVSMSKGVSTSTSYRSVISSPTLLSTTNENVAREEGIEQTELYKATLTETSSSTNQLDSLREISKVTEMSRSVSAPQAQILSDKIGCAIAFNESRSNMEKRSKQQKFMTFGGWMKGRSGTGPGPVQHCERTGHQNEREISLSVEQRITRRKAETLNLCKSKIKALTGHGHIRRKSIKDSNYGLLDRSHVSSADEPREDYVDSLISASSARQVEGMINTKSTAQVCQDETNSEVSSLDLNKINNEIGSLAPDHSVDANPAPNVQKDNDSELMLDLRFARPAVPEEAHPLQMHPNPTDFISSPPRSNSLPHVTSESPNAEVDEEGDQLDLEDAPIYSPSLGNLAQYARRVNDTEAPNLPLRAPGHTFDIPCKTSSTFEENFEGPKNKGGLGLFHRPKKTKGVDPSAQIDGFVGAHKQLKKTRSMLMSGLFKNEVGTQTPVLRRNVTAAFVPMAPSPLRNETHVRRARNGELLLKANKQDMESSGDSSQILNTDLKESDHTECPNRTEEHAREWI